MTQAIEIGNGAIAMSPHDEFVARIDYTVDRAQRALLALQKPEGYWHGAARSERGDERGVHHLQSFHGHG